MKKQQLKQDAEYNFPYHYIPRYKDSFSQNYHWAWGKQYLSAIEFILNEIKKDLNDIDSIVDIGCGDGRFTRELHENFQNKKIRGIDYSTKSIDLAKALNPDLIFTCVDIINNKIDEKFDAITLIEVFEHIPIEQASNFAESLKDILNKNGKVFLTVPHENKPLQDKHFQHFNYESLVRYFKNNFDISEVKYIQKHDKLLSLLNKLMFNKSWIINSSFINNLFYKLYKKRYFFASKKNCARIYLKMTKK